MSDPVPLNTWYVCRLCTLSLPTRSECVDHMKRKHARELIQEALRRKNLRLLNEQKEQINNQKEVKTQPENNMCRTAIENVKESSSFNCGEGRNHKSCTIETLPEIIVHSDSDSDSNSNSNGSSESGDENEEEDCESPVMNDFSVQTDLDVDSNSEQVLDLSNNSKIQTPKVEDEEEQENSNSDEESCDQFTVNEILCGEEENENENQEEQIMEQDADAEFQEHFNGESGKIRENGGQEEMAQVSQFANDTDAAPSSLQGANQFHPTAQIWKPFYNYNLPNPTCHLECPSQNQNQFEHQLQNQNVEFSHFVYPHVYEKRDDIFIPPNSMNSNPNPTSSCDQVSSQPQEQPQKKRKRNRSNKKNEVSFELPINFTPRPNLPVPSHIQQIKAKDGKTIYHCPLCMTSFRTKSHVKYHTFCANPEKQPSLCGDCIKFAPKAHGWRIEFLFQAYDEQNIQNCSICEKPVILTQETLKASKFSLNAQKGVQNKKRMIQMMQLNSMGESKLTLTSKSMETTNTNTSPSTNKKAKTNARASDLMPKGQTRTEGHLDREMSSRGKRSAVCELCPKVLSSSQAFNYHNLGHKGQFPFEEQRFGGVGNMNKHVVQHSGARKRMRFRTSSTIVREREEEMNHTYTNSSANNSTEMTSTNPAPSLSSLQTANLIDLTTDDNAQERQLEHAALLPMAPKIQFSMEQIHAITQIAQIAAKILVNGQHLSLQNS